MSATDRYTHQLDDGLWIVAHWSDLHSQWQSSNRPSPWQGYCYSYARSLEGLRRDGIRTYATRAAARRAARRVYASEILLAEEV